MSYQTVLVALDRDQSTEKVISRGLSLVNGDQRKVFFVHVNQPIIVNTLLNGEMTFPVEVEQELLQASKSWLETTASNIGVNRSNCFVLEGDIKPEIIKKANDLKADVIVVGNHQKHGLALFFSDTADSLLHQIDCDLLAVHIE